MVNAIDEETVVSGQRCDYLLKEGRRARKEGRKAIREGRKEALLGKEGRKEGD